MAGRRKARNQRKGNVSLVTSGLALFFLRCFKMGAMFYLPNDVRAAEGSTAYTPDAVAPQCGEGDPELGAYMEGQPHLPAVLLSLTSTTTHWLTIWQRTCSRRIWWWHGLK